MSPALPRVLAPPRAAKARRPRHRWLAASAGLAAALVLLPVASLLVLAFTGGWVEWPHLAQNVLPGASLTTLTLLSLVAAGTALIGVASAWLVAEHEFPLRRMLAWALVLPLAVPTYLAAYAFGEFFDFTGPVQTGFRALTGFETARDYWFPEVRSLPGLALVLISVLYPYVYLTTRMAFLMQGRHVADVARTLGAKPRAVFWRVALPVARPAVVAGVALALMETLNDLGAAEYFGVRTLTSAVYSTWLNRGSLEGAAQLALAMLVLVLLLVALERWARRRQRFGNARSTQMRRPAARRVLPGWRGIAAAFALFLPVLLGFGVPLAVFGGAASRRLETLVSPKLAEALVTTIVTAGAAATLTVLTALFLVQAARTVRSSRVQALAGAAMLGYALPGTVLGLGLLFALTAFDNGLDALLRAWLGVSTGLLVTGSAAAVVLACTIRFLALGEGALRSGFEKLPGHLDEAARCLGRSQAASLRAVVLPLLKPAILTALVLVFVDTAKELSATILLRPFGFDTLATLTYENASRGAPEDGALAALLIVLVALGPVILLSGALAQDRT
ncbi:MAG TPA: iron ABC transporter permease [Mesorhizobium sp.]|nr:iron ABC transporter permease [Mesorhizobium sp.]